VYETTCSTTDSRWPFRMALVLACATFPLIWIGGLVTTYDAGMAVPDWPSTYGYNLFLYPWQTWVYGPFDLFIEHGHRLLGAVVGILTIALLAVVWRADRRPWMKAVAVAALAGVICQGLLGGLRVRMDARQLAMLHGCLGPAFFAVAAVIVLFTSSWWRRSSSDPSASHLRIQPLALMVMVIAYGQLVVGALLRHTPIDASFAFFRGAVFFHLILAAALFGHVVWLGLVVRRGFPKGHLLRRISAFATGLIAFQIVLGALSWIVKYGWPDWAVQWSWNADYTVRTNTLLQSWTVTAHVANGSLILAAAAVLFASVCRQSGLSEMYRAASDETSSSPPSSGSPHAHRTPATARRSVAFGVEVTR